MCFCCISAGIPRNYVGIERITRQCADVGGGGGESGVVMFRELWLVTAAE